MKYLLILLFSLNANAFTLEQIEELEISYGRIAYRLDKDCVIEFSGTGKQTYEGMDYLDCEKPSEAEFEAEFLVYKAELVVLEEARIAERARIAALLLRYRKRIYWH